MSFSSTQTSLLSSLIPSVLPHLICTSLKVSILHGDETYRVVKWGLSSRTTGGKVSQQPLQVEEVQECCHQGGQVESGPVHSYCSGVLSRDEVTWKQHQTETGTGVPAHWLVVIGKR